MNLALIPVEKLLNASTLVNAHLEVQNRIREAAMVLWRLPKPDHLKHFDKVNRGSLPECVQTWQAYGWEKARMPKFQPMPREIDQCDEVLDWICWLASQDGIEARVVWDTFALRRSMAVTGRRVGMNRNYVSKRAKAGIQKIVERFVVVRRVA